MSIAFRFFPCAPLSDKDEITRGTQSHREITTNKVRGNIYIYIQEEKKEPAVTFILYNACVREGEKEEVTIGESVPLPNNHHRSIITQTMCVCVVFQACSFVFLPIGTRPTWMDHP